MSADNFWWVTVHPKGGFTYVMGFASDDEPPIVDESRDLPRFDLLDEAWIAATRDGWTEYGVSIDPLTKYEVMHSEDTKAEILAVLCELVEELRGENRLYVADVLEGVLPIVNASSGPWTFKGSENV